MSIPVLVPFTSSNHSALQRRVDLRIEMSDADQVHAVPRAGTYWRVGVPTHVGLEHLSEAWAPVLLGTQLDHRVISAGKARSREQGMRTAIDGGCQPRALCFLQPVVNLADVAE